MTEPETVEAIAVRVAELLAERDRPALVDAHTASELLGVPHTWLLAEARANRVPHVRLGRYVRFHPDDLHDWTRQRVRGPRPRKAAA